MKAQRQAAIMKIVKSGGARSQADLVEALRRHGFEVSQTTVSRDLADLGLARRRGEGGARYSEPGGDEEPTDATLKRVAPEVLLTVEPAGNIVVVKTSPGNAQGLAWAIDAAALDGVAGTVGGDDTILVVCSSGSTGTRVAKLLMKYALEQR